MVDYGKKKGEEEEEEGKEQDREQPGCICFPELRE